MDRVEKEAPPVVRDADAQEDCIDVETAQEDALRDPMAPDYEALGQELIGSGYQDSWDAAGVF